MLFRLPFLFYCIFIVRVRSHPYVGFLFKIAFLYLERDPRPTWRLTNTRIAAMNDNWRDVFIKTRLDFYFYEKEIASIKTAMKWWLSYFTVVGMGQLCLNDKRWIFKMCLRSDINGEIVGEVEVRLWRWVVLSTEAALCEECAHTMQVIILQSSSTKVHVFIFIHNHNLIIITWGVPYNCLIFFSWLLLAEHLVSLYYVLSFCI